MPAGTPTLPGSPHGVYSVESTSIPRQNPGMTLTVNGETKEFDGDSMSLPDLLRELSMDEVPVVVEHNLEPLLPAQHAATTLAHGDRLEIIRVVAGG